MIIKSSNSLCQDYDSFSRLAKDSHEPIFITKDGEGDLVLMSIALYEHFLAETSKLAPVAAQSKEEDETTMTEYSLGRILKAMYEQAPRGLQVANIHVFSIFYADIIEKNRLNKKEILRAAGLPESYQTEMSKGINLAQYVTVKESIAQNILFIQNSFFSEIR